LSIPKNTSESQENYQKIIIEQASTAMAMVDNNMCYIAASQSWIRDYGLEGMEIIGESHYDIFPEIGDDWKAMHNRCLNGATDICEETSFKRTDGTVQWIYWDVRPWYISKGEIGGILMHTGDITRHKERELEKARIEEILEKTNEVARIGIWEVNLIKNEVYLSKIVREIFEVNVDFIPSIDSIVNFFKKGINRKSAQVIFNNAVTKGISFDKEFEIKTEKGSKRWIRAIGKAEFLDGKTTKLFGIFQDISESKFAELKLNKAYAEIKYAENELVKKNQLLNFAEQITMMGNWQWDTLTNNVRWSTNLYSIFGIEDKNTKLTFGTYFEYVHLEDQDFVSKHVENSIAERKFDSLLHRIKLKDGTVKTIQLMAEIVINSANEVVELLGTCQDVTEIKMAERKFRGLLESAPDAMVIVNDKGAIQLINKQSEKLFGYTSKELFNKSVETLIPSRFIANHNNYRNSFFHTPVTREMGDGKNLYGLTKNGREIPIQISLSPLRKEEGLLVSAAIRDITKQKESEKNILLAKKNLEEVAKKLGYQNKQLADFTHITSHNLRAPVANLNSLMEIYKSSENETERLDIFNKFDIVIDRLTLTLDTLMESLKARIGDSNEELETIDLKKVLKNTTQILSGAILKSGAIIEGDFSEVSNITYKNIYMESIFLNLIGNAIKYRKQDRKPEILITSKLKKGRKILTFKDNGLGIDLERHGHKLFGLNKVFHRHPDANGVGLFLTKTQVEAMGGTISATSEVNVGTTFKIIF
tara:strand:- start:733 stop:3015 length:2283 start_codon:yes stop_codon:yes gene_type:complete